MDVPTAMYIEREMDKYINEPDPSPLGMNYLSRLDIDELHEHMMRGGGLGFGIQHSARDAMISMHYQMLMQRVGQ